MYIRHNRYRRFSDDLCECLRIGLSRYGNTHKVATRFFKFSNLPQTRGHIRRKYLGHRLYGDRMPMSQFERAYADGFCFSSFNHNSIILIECDYKINLFLSRLIARIPTISVKTTM